MTNKLNRHTVFVYGTLLQGEGNNTLLDSAEYLGKANLESKNFKMLGENRGFPYVVPTEEQQSSTVRGEVYKVDDITLEELDWLEGTPSHYTREQVDVVVSSNQQKLRQVYMYVASPSTQEGIKKALTPLQEVKENCWLTSKKFRMLEYAEQLEKRAYGMRV